MNNLQKHNRHVACAFDPKNETDRIIVSLRPAWATPGDPVLKKKKAAAATTKTKTLTFTKQNKCKNPNQGPANHICLSFPSAGIKGKRHLAQQP